MVGGEQGSGKTGATLVDSGASPIGVRVSSPGPAPPSSWNAPTNTKGAWKCHLMYLRRCLCDFSAQSRDAGLIKKHTALQMGQSRRSPGQVVVPHSTSYFTVSSGSRYKFGNRKAPGCPKAQRVTRSASFSFDIRCSNRVDTSHPIRATPLYAELPIRLLDDDS